MSTLFSPGARAFDTYHLVAGCRRIPIERNDILVPSELRRPYSLPPLLTPPDSSPSRLPADIFLPPTLVAVNRRWPLTDLRS